MVVQSSSQESLADGTWRHTRIRLLPETDREGYDPIELQAEEAEDLRIVAEWLGPVG